MATNTQKTGVRKFLTDSGYKDSDVSAAPAAAYTPQAYGGFSPNTSQAFQTAKQNVLQDAVVATNNTMVSMGTRGIGNSSAAVDRGNQIQQSAVSRIKRPSTVRKGAFCHGSLGSRIRD